MKFLKGLLKLLLGVVVVIGIIVAIAFYLISSPKKTIEVTYTTADFESYVAKGGITFDDSHASMEDLFANNVTTTGVVPVDTVVTNEELTAVANMSMNDNSIVKDVIIKCTGDDQIEMSCVIGDISPLVEQFPVLEKYEVFLNTLKNKPIYMSSTLFYNPSTGLFDGVTEELYVGKIKIPVNQANDSLRPAGTELNNILDNLDGFTVNEFSVTEEGFDFDGTIPEKIESAGSFEDIANGLSN